MSFMHSLTFEIISSLSSWTGPLTSPDKTTLLVVVNVSQATLANGALEIK